MQSAALIGARHHRSAAEQIEYWEALGRQVARVLDPDCSAPIRSALQRKLCGMLVRMPVRGQSR